MKKANRRIIVAMICYGILILVALVTMLPVRSSDESFLLIVVLLVFALLIIKTLIGVGPT